MYHIILAGGSGTRFWPLSTEEKPKQFLKFFNNESLIQSTYNRLLKVAPKEKIFILTSKKYKNNIQDHLGDVNFIIEPSPKNTTAAIYLAAQQVLGKSYINDKTNQKDEILGFYPSDHYIDNKDNYFGLTINKAKNFLGKNKEAILTIGIKPTYPSTEYGYIENKKDSILDFQDIYKTSTFIEKPSVMKAEKLIDSDRNLWNAGIFFFSAKTIIKEIEKYQAEFKNKSSSIEKDWNLMPSISIDYSVMEKTKNCYCIKSKFTWSDIGNWESLYKILPKDKFNNVIKGKHLGYNSENNLIISPKKIIATIGLDNIAVIDTDDTTLIVNLKDSGDVKKLKHQK